MIQFLTPTVGFLHSMAIESSGPSKAPYVLGYMAITTPMLSIVARKEVNKGGFVQRPVMAAVLAASIAQGALYGVGRTLGHMWS